MSPNKKSVAKSAAKKTSSPAAEIKTVKKSDKPAKASPPKAPGKKPASSVKPSSPKSPAALDMPGVGIYAADKNRLIYVSPVFEKMTGYTAKELIGMDMLACIHPEDQNAYKKNAQARLKKTRPLPYQYRWIRKNGETALFLETASAAPEFGKTAVRAVVMDVSRWLPAKGGTPDSESELKLSEARLQSLFEMTQMPTQSITELLDKALDHAIELTGSKIGYIYYYNEATRQFTLNTWSKDVMKECLVTEPQTIYDLDKTGIWGEAVRQRKPIVLNDYAATNPLKKGYPEGHVHLRRFLTIPVLSGDKIIAVVGVANKEKEYDESDIRQLTLLMDAVWTISERRRMETELIKKEEGYRTILEAIDEGFCEMDLKGNIMFVNYAGARIIGLTPQEMIGTNFRRYVSRSTLEDLLGRFKEIYKTRKPIKRFEMEYINKDGIRRYLEVSGALMIDPDGKPVGFRGLAHDITQSKWTEEALLQSEAKYFSIIESIGHAYFETDLRGCLTFFNDKVCDDLGYSRSELLSMSHRDLQDAENAQKTFEVFNRVYQTGEPNLDYVYEAICKDGSRAVFEISVSLRRDAQGEPIGFRGLSRDITERRRMEKALKASEERARSIIATIPDPYFEIDPDRNITYVNQAFQSLVGYNLDELTRMDQKTYLGEKAAEDLSTLYNTVRVTGITMKNVELEIINRDGEKRMVNLSVSLIRDPQGEPTGFHGIMRDITDKKEADALILESSMKLMEYSESLEHSVQQRTAELEKAKVEAEAASRAKSDFLANISHEFQTPLNSVVGFTKVLKDRLFGDLNAKQEEFVQYISDAGETLSKLLNEIIDVSSVSSGRTRLNLTPVAISKALGQAASLIGRQITEKGHALTVDVALDADVSIEADEEKVRHIFFQLLSNAVKYTPAGGKITVMAQKAVNKAGDEGILVSVSDNGPGIKAEDIPKLFQNFGRLESAYTRQSSGVGVGLSLTRQLVELLGGEIGVESVYGTGSTFSVFMPLKQKHQDLLGL